MFSVFSEESAQSEAEAGRLPRCKQLRRILPGAGDGFHCPHPVSDESGCWPGRQRGDDCLLRNDLEIAEACGSVGIVVHFGHFAGMEPLQGYQKIIQCMNEVLADWTGRTKLLLENMAGNHGYEGMTPEELVKVRELCRYPEKIGFCFDTCHAFAAGIWNPEQTEELIARGEKLGYWANLAAVHLNDSRFPYGSRRDRHAGIGSGYIGGAALSQLVKMEFLADKVIVMETEKGPDGTHRAEIAAVRTWFEAGED